jgi:type VI secretion system protein ImpF
MPIDTTLQRALMPSLIDRLNDDDPGTQVEVDRGLSFEEYKRGLVRDLSELFNTRRSPPWLDGDYPQLERSLLAYGLPDLTNFNPRNPEDRQNLVRAMERAVRQFEPRLARARIELIAAEGDEAGRDLRFRLDAILRLHPRPVAVSFDTVLQSVTNQFDVREGG